jgi:proteic killer suppression protein
LRFQFRTDDLRELYVSEKNAHRYPPQVVTAFFKVMDIIASVEDERDLRAFKSLHYHKLSGQRSHQHALNLHGGHRLIVERQQDEQGSWLLIIEIEDYH